MAARQRPQTGYKRQVGTSTNVVRQPAFGVGAVKDLTPTKDSFKFVGSSNKKNDRYQNNKFADEKLINIRKKIQA